MGDRSQTLGRISIATFLVALHAVAANAQPIGTFAWQLQPFCNQVIVNVTQNGAVYTFDGYDTQCGGSPAPLVGTANLQSRRDDRGGVDAGLTIVTTPGSAPIHITAVNTPAGSGLSGGSASGDVTLGVVFGGTGAAAIAARSDHTHATAGIQNVGVGPGALAAVTTGVGNTALGDTALNAATTTINNTAIGNQTLRVATGGQNTAIGAGVMENLTTGAQNTAIGSLALQNLVTGNNSTGVGFLALRANTASGNIALGSFSLRSNTIGNNNVALGGGALLNSTTASFNVASDRVQ